MSAFLLEGVPLLEKRPSPPSKDCAPLLLLRLTQDFDGREKG
jgi:hypothetical protein